MRVRVRTSAVVVLALVLAVAGCGGGSNKKASKSNELVFWNSEDNAVRVKATQAIIDRFTKQTGIKVKVASIGEDKLQSQIASASAAGDLPDLFGSLSLGFTQSLVADDIADPDAAAAVVDQLGRDTFSKRALSLVETDGKPAAIPSDSWTQLLVYRKDLFAAAGLAVPDTFDKIQAAATRLKAKGMSGIVAATKPGDSFTQQTFEYFAVADNCQLTDDAGKVTLTSPACVNTFRFYTDLIHNASVKGAQDVDSTRAAYFAGKAAMLVWSSFILDELAGLRDDALPTCPQCKGDKSFLSKNSGIVTAVKGPDATEPSQFGEVTSFVISKDGNTDAAKKLVQFMLNDAYVDWLALAPEGKFPVRKGTKDEPDKFTKAWGELKAGVDRKEPLSAVYPPEVLGVLGTSTDTMNRWGFPQGQGKLVGAQLAELPVPKALAAALDGKLDPAAAAKQAQADVEEIAQSLK
jgi:multiple sugar transport system substrate-binding protein